MYYIQQIDKPCWLKKTFNIITTSNNKIIIPITTNQEISQKKAEKLSTKTAQIISRTNCKKILISKELKKQINYVNYLYTYNFEMPNGNWLFEVLSYEAVNYITKVKELKKQETVITILANDPSEYTLANIKKLVQEYKRTNIVTNNLEKFKNIEKSILQEYGIMITVTNNKKKSLSKSKIILNIDFSTETINQYNINEEAIILNIQNNVKIEKKRFNGININDYEIEIENQQIQNKEILQKYNLKEMYESNFYKRQPYDEIVKRIKKDGVLIKKLYGVNSIL